MYKDKYDFEEVVPISALEGNNVSNLLELLQKQLPPGPMYYDEDQITDHPENFIIRELIREKVLQLTKEEVPHSIAVVLENIEKRDRKSTRLNSSHVAISYAVFCLKKKTDKIKH